MPRLLSREVLAKVAAHALKEGREDYQSRANDVAFHGEDPEWAWPYSTADEAYLNAVGTHEICRELGLPSEAWDEISEMWLDSFAKGYKAAHDAECVVAASALEGEAS